MRASPGGCTRGDCGGYRSTLATLEAHQRLVGALCSEACAGRRAGTPGGLHARRIVVEALRAAGLDPHEQPAPGCGGANVLATLPGTVDRWVLVGAHYDHLGTMGDRVFHGANDNAAAVSMLVAVAGALAARRPDGRGVIFAAFDGEEPPFFATGAMGSQTFVRSPMVPLDRIDMMVALELLGHRIGPAGLPDAVGSSVFALGAERSAGTSARIDALSTATPGLTVRRADAEVIPPLSDHLGVGSTSATRPPWPRGRAQWAQRAPSSAPSRTVGPAGTARSRPGSAGAAEGRPRHVGAGGR